MFILIRTFRSGIHFGQNLAHKPYSRVVAEYGASLGCRITYGKEMQRVVRDGRNSSSRPLVFDRDAFLEVLVHLELPHLGVGIVCGTVARCGLRIDDNPFGRQHLEPLLVLQVAEGHVVEVTVCGVNKHILGVELSTVGLRVEQQYNLSSEGGPLRS